jgi:hypothetical protein
LTGIVRGGSFMNRLWPLQVFSAVFISTSWLPGQESPGLQGKPATSMVQHNTMMMMQQQTFTPYMWSRGFNYAATGEMW